MKFEAVFALRREPRHLRDAGLVDYAVDLASAAAVMLAFAVGLLVAVFGAWAAEPARPQPTAERAGTDVVRALPTAKRFAPPNQPDVSDRDSIYVDELYRQLIGPPPATSSGSRSITRLQPAPKR